MAKNSCTYTLNYQVERVYAVLTTLRKRLADALHEDDRKELEDMIGQAEDALGIVSNVLPGLRRKLEDVADSL